MHEVLAQLPAAVVEADRSSGNISDERKTYLVPLNELSTLPDFEQSEAMEGFDPDFVRVPSSRKVLI